jgi:hypothetical protein
MKQPVITVRTFYHWDEIRKIDSETEWPHECYVWGYDGGHGFAYRQALAAIIFDTWRNE